MSEFPRAAKSLTCGRFPSAARQLGPVDDAAFHDKSHPLGDRDVVERVARYRDQIRELARFDGADAILPMNDERSLVAFDPIVGTNVPLMKAMGDPAEMALLHMVTKDPARTPTFIYFANDDFFITARSKSMACTSIAACSDEQPGFNWNHGDVQSDITHTWLGMVGPGVRRMGRSGKVFTDHTDIRPTLVSLAGLTDDYSHDGRVVFEILDRDALPHSLREHEETLSALAAAYKSINAPLGELGRKSLRIATHALTGDATTIDALDGRINDLTARRNAIASDMVAMLEAAEFHNTPVDRDEAWELIERARELLESLH